MHNSRNKKKLQIFLFVLIAVLTLGIGYASITAVNLMMNGKGTASASKENFKVYFTESTITEGKGTVSIDEDDATIGYFDITGLSKVGDYAEATYTVLNNSNTIGAKISLNVTNSNIEYFKVTETVADSELQVGDETTATVKVEMIKTPINTAVTTSVIAKLITSPVDNESATKNSSLSIEKPTEFEKDSWSTIKTNIQNNNTSQYNIGDTKIVTINNKKYTVRIANKTTGEHCGDEDITYSQTACGFVVEFVDIITKMKMYDNATNVGGYPTTLVYDYLKNTLYGQLPEDLQLAIKPTRVISGYGCISGMNGFNCANPDNDGNNYTTIDKLYLLSAEEVYGTDEGILNFYDTAIGATHQLDFYRNNEVAFNSNTNTGTNIGIASKKYTTYILWWWLRTPAACNYYSFANVSATGVWNTTSANNTPGVAPAFRIG